MNLTETAKLMTMIAAFSNREPQKSAVVAWQSILGDVSLADAEEAVRRHYAESTDWIMPAHILRAVAEIELERARAARRWAPGQAGVPADEPMPVLLSGEVTVGMSPTVRRLLDELREQLEDAPRAKLFPRQAHWEREQKAFLRAHGGEPNPLYKPTAADGEHQHSASCHGAIGDLLCGHS